MKFGTIASGSSGNCLYAGNDNTHILIDAGISCKRIVEGLKTFELEGKNLQGILVTHEHTDHVSGLGVLSRKYHIPIYGTEKTLRKICEMENLGKIDRELFQPIQTGKNFFIGDLDIESFSISHDAADPVAYRFKCGHKQVAVATDMGTYNDYTVECLKGMDALLLEANHDVHMLQVGPYPYPLKQRILGDRGHLSNERSGQLLSKLLHDKLQTIVLGHLSQENNLPELAYETVRLEINMEDNPYKADDFKISVARRSAPSQPIVSV